MNIYLAGKISDYDWRHQVVLGLTDKLKALPADGTWPLMDASILGLHGYTGPYFRKIEKTAGDQTPTKVHRLCLSAVMQSDLVYAWVDDVTAYATIYEMGYAAALGKFTAVAYPTSFDRSELWFMSCCSDEIIEATGPITGLHTAIMRMAKKGRVPDVQKELAQAEDLVERLKRLAPGGLDGTSGGDARSTEQR